MYDVVSAPLRALLGASGAEFVLNAALLVPLGAVAGWVGSRPGLVAVIDLGMAVEVLQAFLGRDPGIDDAAAYLIGAVGGYALAGWSSKRRGPRRRRRRRRSSVSP
ncbi:MAG: hypothetical protein KY461_13580 [Actinobacteria bacterium]|nr:hypothetical protein [Actinomycetota bacterium]